MRTHAHTRTHTYKQQVTAKMGARSDKTKHKDNTYKAVFNTELLLSLPTSKDSWEDLHLEVSDWNRLLPPSFIGSMVVPASELRALKEAGKGGSNPRSAHIVDKKGGQVRGQDGKLTTLKFKLSFEM